jgi:hypothetical protein
MRKNMVWAVLLSAGLAACGGNQGASVAERLTLVCKKGSAEAERADICACAIARAMPAMTDLQTSVMAGLFQRQKLYSAEPRYGQIMQIAADNGIPAADVKALIEEAEQTFGRAAEACDRDIQATK